MAQGALSNMPSGPQPHWNNEEGIEGNAPRGWGMPKVYDHIHWGLIATVNGDIGYVHITPDREEINHPPGNIFAHFYQNGLTGIVVLDRVLQCPVRSPLLHIPHT